MRAATVILLLIAGCATPPEVWLARIEAECSIAGADSRPNPSFQPYVRRLMTRCELMGVNLSEEPKLIRCVELLHDQEEQRWQAQYDSCVRGLIAEDRRASAAQFEGFMRGYNSGRPIQTQCRPDGLGGIRCTN